MEGTSTEENLLKREIEDLPVVSSLSFIRAIGRDKAGYRVNLFCDAVSLYGGCKNGTCTVNRVGPAGGNHVHQTSHNARLFVCASDTNPAGIRAGRTRIQVLWTESHGGRLYAHQTDLLDRRRMYCVGMRAGSRALVTAGGEAGASWTLLAAEVRQGSGK